MKLSPETTDAIAAIHNDQLRWDGTPVGLMPKIADPRTHALIATDEPVDAALVDALTDPDRYAVAHVILTQRRREPFSTDGSQWNGLHVTLSADGSVRYQPDDREALRRTWQQRLSAQ